MMRNTLARGNRLTRSLAVALALLASARPTFAENAESLAESALERYEAGDLTGAAQLFLQAHELSGHPTPLRNAARALEQAGRRAEALLRWRQYAALPELTPDKRALALDRIEALTPLQERSRVAETPPIDVPYGEPPPGPLLPPKPPQEAPVPPSPLLRFVLIGAGGAAIGGGGALYASGWWAYGRFDATRATVQEITREEADAARVRAGVGLVLAGVGVATIIGTLLFVDTPAEALRIDVGAEAGGPSVNASMDW